MALISARISVEGRRPLLWNRFGAESLPLERRGRSGVAGNDPEEWRRTVLATRDGQLFLEPSYVFSCLRDAAKYTQRRRGTLQPILASTMQVQDDRILVDRWLPKKDLADLKQAEEEPVYLDVRSVRNPSTRARNLRYRVAASPGWKATFTITWEDTLISETEMRAVIRDAGRFTGLGDGRSIGFGRFEVRSMEIDEVESAKEKTATRGVGRNAPESLGTGRKAVRTVRKGG